MIIFSSRILRLLAQPKLNLLQNITKKLLIIRQTAQTTTLMNLKDHLVPQEKGLK
jgi:hypothetical protein